MRDIYTALCAPFPASEVSWRLGSTTKDKTRGMALAFIDSRAVMDRLDEVVGPSNWGNNYSHADAKTVCNIGVSYGGEFVWKADGAGDTDFEASKGALSDAFKRAAVRHGIGRYLYNLPTPWVEIEEYGSAAKPAYRIKQDQYSILNAVLNNQIKIVAEATQASNAGLDFYKKYYLALKDEQRNLLSSFHEQLKRNAEHVSSQQKKAA